MGKRSGSTMAWSLGVGWLGALAIGVMGVAMTVMLDLVSGALDILRADHSASASTNEVRVVTGASMALCLAVACGAGWTLARAPDGLTPRWMAGLGAGLVGLVAGGALFAIGLGFTPI
jgi:hypothetical protein